MNRDASAPKTDQQLWTVLPLQVPSRGGNDAQETAILSSIQTLDSTRLKRARSRGDATETEQTLQPHRQHSALSVPLSRTTVEPLKPVFQLRSLSLDRGAIAPGLARPTAPFAKSARKKAYVSAVYYSECFLRNIEPRQADLAAFHVQNQYTKWWVDSKKQNPSSSDSNTTSSSKRKRRRLESPLEAQTSLQPSSTTTTWDPEVVTLLKEKVVELMQKTGGDTSTTEFQRCLEQLQAVYATQSNTTTATSGNGTWLNLSRPNYSESQGRNQYGEYLYSLGRMSFDMFRPTHLKCSIRAVMNNVRLMDPKSKPQSFPSRLAKVLKEHNGNVDNPIRHYDIVVAFTIQANQTRNGTEPLGDDQEFVIPRPIRGLMTNHGYMVDDPKMPNRSSIWFSGGSIEVQDEVADAEIWKQIFDETLVPRRDNKATANMLAAKLLLGAQTTTSSSSGTSVSSESNNEGSSVEESVPAMNYFFKRPIGGHGEVYCDVLYVDDTMRITQGHRGSTFVSTRVPLLEEPKIAVEE